MKKVLFFLALSLFMVIINGSSAMAYEREMKTLSSSLAETINKGAIRTVAVADFTDLQGDITELGRFLSEELSGELATTGKNFEVVDRVHLKTILAEHKLSVSGLMDPNTVKKLGQISGVGGIVTGSVTPFGENVRLSCKVIATDTAKVIGAAKVDIPKTKAIEELLGKGIEGSNRTISAQKGGANSSDKTEKIYDIQSTITKNLLLEATICTYSGDEITCPILMTSKDKDIQIVLRPMDILIIDENGNEMKSSNIQFGQNVGGYGNGRLMTGLPTKAIFKFGDIKQAPRLINFVILSAQVSNPNIMRGGGERFWSPYKISAQIRNIPIILTDSDIQQTTKKRK